MQHDKIFDASITLSCKPIIATDILARFRDRPPREAMFLKTCFGMWLDIPMVVDGDSSLLHYVFCIEVVADPHNEAKEMIFEIEGYELTFGKRELCLVNDFQFDEYFGGSDSNLGVDVHDILLNELLVGRHSLRSIVLSVREGFQWKVSSSACER